MFWGGLGPEHCCPRGAVAPALLGGQSPACPRRHRAEECRGAPAWTTSTFNYNAPPQKVQ